FQQCQVDDVPLSMTASESIRNSSGTAQLRYCGFEITIPKSCKPLGKRQAIASRPFFRFTVVATRSLQIPDDLLDTLSPAGTQICHHRVPVVKWVRTAINMQLPSIRH